ncbi:MAG: DMT family transporter [Dongiaceae bacterium]
MSRRRLFLYSLLLILGINYGAFYTVNRLAADAGIPPIAYAFWQSLGAAIVLVVAALARGDRLGLSRAHIVSYLVIGPLALGIPVSLLTFVAPNLPAGALTLVLALNPPITYGLSMLFGVDRFRSLVLAGLTFGLMGVAMIVGPSATLGGPGKGGWYLLGLIAPVLIGSSNVAAAILRPPVASSLSMSAGVMLGAALPLLPTMLIAGQGWEPVGASIDALIPLIAAIAVNCIGYVLFFEVVRMAGPTFFSQFSYFAVLAGIAWSNLVLGERPSAYLVVAMLLMFMGMFTAGYRLDAPRHTLKT